MPEKIPLGLTPDEREAMLANRNRIRIAEPAVQPADNEDAGMGILTARDAAEMSAEQIEDLRVRGFSVPEHYLVASGIARTRASDW